MRRDFYVDDGLKSVPTAEGAIALIEKSKKLCAQGGLRLHKFVSNSVTVLESIPPEDRAKGVKDLDLRQDPLPIERALGVQWCIESDTFRFRISLLDRPLTRHGVLSTLCSVYNPLGFLAPVVLAGKQILQQMCREQLSWDNVIPDALRSRWERWRCDLPNLEKITIQRRFKPDGFGEVRAAELHHFSDASTSGYGQCSYLRLVDTKSRVHCSLVMGKARVTPLKVITIPRLELTAALVSINVSKLLQQELECNVSQEVFWTDSKVVLGYIANDSRRFHVFVANRVQQIRDHTMPSQWRHVRTEENPADDASRGLTVDGLVQSKWLTGPDFLWMAEILIGDEDTGHATVGSNDPEVKAQAFASHEIPDHSDFLTRLEYFSDWKRAKRAVACCLKFKDRLRRREIKKGQLQAKCGQPVTVEDLQKAELEVIKHVQRENFQKEIEILESVKVTDSTPDRRIAKQRNKMMRGTSTVYRLDPFLDEDGVMRVGGRIRNAEAPTGIRHPIILPRTHHITTLVIRHCHVQIQHQGRGMTTNEIRHDHQRDSVQWFLDRGMQLCCLQLLIQMRKMQEAEKQSTRAENG